MSAPWNRTRAVLALLLAAGAIQCASAPSTPQTSRSAPVGGLAPLPPSPTTAPRVQGTGEEAGAKVASVRTGARTTDPARATACAARVGPSAIKRSALSRTLDAGLGAWLRGVDIEPKLARGRFQGWLVRAIHPGDPCWADIDLKAGDVVNRINRRPIERPEEAQAVWTALRTAGEIVVEFQRAGEAHTLKFAVVDDRE